MLLLSISLTVLGIFYIKEFYILKKSKFLRHLKDILVQHETKFLISCLNFLLYAAETKSLKMQEGVFRMKV